MYMLDSYESIDFVAALSCDNMCLHSEQCLFVIVLFWGIFKITVTPRYKCYVDVRERVKKAHVFFSSFKVSQEPEDWARAQENN